MSGCDTDLLKYSELYIISKSFWILFVFFLFSLIVIVITFYSPSCLGQETTKGPFGLRVKLPLAHLSTTHGRGFTQSLSALIAERQAGKLRIPIFIVFGLTGPGI